MVEFEDMSKESLKKAYERKFGEEIEEEVKYELLNNDYEWEEEKNTLRKPLVDISFEDVTEELAPEGFWMSHDIKLFKRVGGCYDGELFIARVKE